MSHKGFTLVELAIVIVIIGLLVGGVLQGQELIRQAQVRKAVTDLLSYDTAITLFKDKYKSLPGDFSRATAFFTGTTNGDNDGQIVGATLESPLVWQHLALANLIKGGFTGTGIGASPKIGVNAPVTSINGVTMTVRYTRNYSLPYKNLNEYGAPYATEYYAAEAGFMSDQAQQIDTKLDDGVANRGRFMGVDGNGAVANSCSAPHSTVGGADYNLTSTIVSCRLFYEISAN